MPWKETSVGDQRRRFVQDYYRQVFSVAELCRRYGVSRETGYKWVRRFEDEGVPSLEDRSRRPHSCAHATPSYVVWSKHSSRLVGAALTGTPRSSSLCSIGINPDWPLPAPRSEV